MDQGYITWSEVDFTWGEVSVTYWQLLQPTIRDLRSSSKTASVYGGFEGIAKRAQADAAKRGDDWSMPDEAMPAALEAQIGRNQARLRLLRAVRLGVIPGEAV